MAVRLRLKRFGRLNHPTYRVCATDPRFPRDGRIIESLGYYLPLMPRQGDQVRLNEERVKYWLSVGALPSETVASLIRGAGIAMPQRKQRVRKKGKAKPFSPPRRRKAKAKAGPTPKADAAGSGA